jgi:hypothetical protein
MLPSGIAVDVDGRIYMVDQFFRKVEVFRPADLPATAAYGVPASTPLLATGAAAAGTPAAPAAPAAAPPAGGAPAGTAAAPAGTTAAPAAR